MAVGGIISDVATLLLIPPQVLSEIKFADALPLDLARRVYRDRVIDYNGVRTVLDEVAQPKDTVTT